MASRAPVIASFLLFLLLCGSVAYWLLQWLAPEPRPVAAPPQAERSAPPVAAASNLFGGSPQGGGMANVQLRGIIRSGRPGGSVAIVAAEGKPTRALPIDAEVLPGLTVKEINARTVVLSDRGTERELSLPAFAAQEGGTSALQAGAPASQPVAPQLQPAPPPQPPPAPQPAPPPSLPQPTATGASGPGSTASGAGSPGAAAAGQPAPAAAPAPPQPQPR